MKALLLISEARTGMTHYESKHMRDNIDPKASEGKCLKETLGSTRLNFKYSDNKRCDDILNNRENRNSIRNSQAYLLENGGRGRRHLKICYAQTRIRAFSRTWAKGWLMAGY